VVGRRWGIFVPRISTASVPPLGYRIQSQSSCDYVVGDERFTILSNLVATEVGPFYRISLTPRGTVSSPAFSLLGMEGDSLYCRFELRNIGKRRRLGRDFVGAHPAFHDRTRTSLVFRDANSDTDFDPGEDDRSFLNIAPGERRELNTLVVLGSGYGGVRASSKSVRVSATGSTPTRRKASSRRARVPSRRTRSTWTGRKPRALPRGEGSPDDVARTGAGFTTQSIVFENDLLNQGRDADVVQIEPADTSGGLRASTWSSRTRPATGSSLPPSTRAPSLSENSRVEKCEGCVSRHPRAESFYHVVNDSLAIRLGTIACEPRPDERHEDRVVLAHRSTKTRCFLSNKLSREPGRFRGRRHVRGRGDEHDGQRPCRRRNRARDVQPALDFLSSAAFEPEDGAIVWRIGPLGPRERRETAVKSPSTAGCPKGWTKVIGDARGTAFSRELQAGPVVNTLRIENDVFSDEAVVLGDVFLDDNGNGKRDEGENGIPRAGVFLESGEYALTDSTGRFSIPRVFSGYRVVRIDEGTLPRQGRHRRLAHAGGRGVRDRTGYPPPPSGHAVVSFPLRPRTGEPDRVSRQISCGEMASVQRRQHALYRWPSIPSSFFEVGKAFLKTGTLTQLDPILDFLGRNPGWMVSSRDIRTASRSTPRRFRRTVICRSRGPKR